MQVPASERYWRNPPSTASSYIPGGCYNYAENSKLPNKSQKFSLIISGNSKELPNFQLGDLTIITNSP
jgi:hypothetical protein